MKYISEEEYNSRMKKIQSKNLSKERSQKLKKEKSKYKHKIKLPSTSKLILIGAVLLCVQIVCFAEYAVIKTGDTSYMYALIGVPATLIPTIWGYYSKSKAENTKGGITYETAMEEMRLKNSENENSENDNSVG